VRCTCSIHGENEQMLPLFLRQARAYGTTSHGRGRSRNTASAEHCPRVSQGKAPTRMSLISHMLQCKNKTRGTELSRTARWPR